MSDSKFWILFATIIAMLLLFIVVKAYKEEHDCKGEFIRNSEGSVCVITTNPPQSVQQ